jgi:two-component system, NtrC family, nitrogen regulation sensor histidine kinase NtrY
LSHFDNTVAVAHHLSGQTGGDSCLWRMDGFRLSIDPSVKGLDLRQDRQRPRRVSGVIGALTVVLALSSALITFLVLSGATPINPVHQVVVGVFVGNALLVLVLVGVVAMEAVGIVKARRAGAAASGLHVRIVALFSIVAALPAVLVAIIATITIERGLEPWFSDRMRDAIFRSIDVADAYTTSQCKALGREIRILADDLTRAQPAFDAERIWFEGFLTTRATALGLPVAALIKPPDVTVLRARIDVVSNPPMPTRETFDDATQSADPICIVPREGRLFGALIKLAAYPETFLHVAREVDALAVESPTIARNAAVEYLAIDARRKGVQVAFASMYALIALILLLSAIWLGLSFANRLVAPIRRMIHATDQVSSGNFYVQVPVRRSEGDLAHLGATFNKMTAELRRQRDSLVSANDLLDRRRRFTETVLSGVSSGVMSIDREGRLTLLNRSAEQLLDLHGGMFGRPLAEIAPELSALVQEALVVRRPVQGQVTITRRGQERLLSIRLAHEGEAEAAQMGIAGSAGATQGSGLGLVVTLDDISDLVSAQRTAAWADVARRIAHEIKNPLTPIQLSAERLKRRFGRLLKDDQPDDKAVFDQCTDTIIRQVDDIRQMVDEFSSFARMPKPQLAREDLAETIQQIVFLMRMGSPDIEIVESLEQGDNTGLFDRRLISQALTNIIKNATEAIAAVPAGERARPRIDVVLRRQPAGMFVIDIMDNGKGLPKEQRQRLMEPYMTTREGGTGLGLAIVGKILEDHGGGIDLLDRSDLGGDQTGACVRLWFPQSGNNAAAEAASSVNSPVSNREPAHDGAGSEQAGQSS